MWDDWVIQGFRHHETRLQDSFEVVKARMAKVETCLDRKSGAFSHEVVMSNIRTLDDAMRRFVAASAQLDYFYQDTFVVKGVGSNDDED
jgi:hypothetical protein